MQNRRKIHFIKKRFQARFIALFCMLVFFGSVTIGGVLYYIINERITETLYRSHIKVRTVGEIVGPVILRVNVAVTIFIIVLGLLLAYLLLRRIEKQLLPFKDYSDRLAEGDLTVSVPDGDDELTADLTEGFNTMIDRLRDRFDSMKRRLVTIDDLLKKLEEITDERREVIRIEPILKELEKEIQGMKEDTETFKI